MQKQEMSKDSFSLDYQFNKVCAAFPALTAGSTPLGYGNYGIVVDHHDGTVSKIAFSDPALSYAEECLMQEIEALQLLQGHRFDQVRTPALVGEPLILDDEQKACGYLGHFRMTKLEGKTRSWLTLLKNGTPSAQSKFFGSLGHLMAQFHAYTAPHYNHDNPGDQTAPAFADHPDLSEDTRAMIGEAQEYLRAHQQPGVIHGDLHSGNVLCSAEGDISGLYDFQLYGDVPNDFQEFCWVMEHFPRALPMIMKGYEEESGQPVDQTALLLTGFSHKLWQLTRSLNNAPEEQRQDLATAVNGRIQQTLRKIQNNPV